jgi:hypothetical protein
LAIFDLKPPILYVNMDLPSLNDLKKELVSKEEKELVGLLLELAKFNKDNKALLYFKLYEQQEPGLFLREALAELQTAFMKGYSGNYHTAKKSAQSARRTLNKLLSFSKDKTTHVELLIAFCQSLREYGYLGFRHPVIENLYRQQLKKLEKALGTLHEDVQYDYQAVVEELSVGFRW